jgi:hypothetical protein
MTERPNNRLKTSVDPLGKPDRTFLEGLEEKTRMGKLQNPQIAATSLRETSSTTRTSSSKLVEPSTYPASQRPSETRMPTHMDPLGKPDRTILEGMLSKKDMSKVEQAQKAEEERKRQK